MFFLVVFSDHVFVGRVLLILLFEKGGHFRLSTALFGVDDLLLPDQKKKVAATMTTPSLERNKPKNKNFLFTTFIYAYYLRLKNKPVGKV